MSCLFERGSHVLDLETVMAFKFLCSSSFLVILEWKHISISLLRGERKPDFAPRTRTFAHCD